MQLKAYILVFNGIADWEPSLALCEINKSKKFDVVSVGFSDSSIITMGGYKISPDIALDAMELEKIAIFIMLGGEMWEQRPHEDVIKLLLKLHARGTVIAAICGATLEVARAGLLHGTKHTSVNFFKKMTRTPPVFSN